MARRLDEALRPGGLYYQLDGTAVDAEGRPLEGAPKRPEDTKPEEQPHALLAAASTVGGRPGAPGGGFDVEALGAAIGRGLAQAAANQQAIKTSEEKHEEVRSGAEGAKIDPERSAVAPSSATADANVGIVGDSDAANAARAAIEAGTAAANDALRASEVARRGTTAAVTGEGRSAAVASAAATRSASSASARSTPASSTSSTSGPSSPASDSTGGPSGSTNDVP